MLNRVALVTADASIHDDHDMPYLLPACAERGLQAEICAWHDTRVRWTDYDAVILRSPWDYPARLREFFSWCQQTSNETRLLNPLDVVKWSLDKHYLADLAAHGVPVVPTTFVEPGDDASSTLASFFDMHRDTDGIVVKPAVGCNSQWVRRFNPTEYGEIVGYIARCGDQSMLLQPYLAAIKQMGETDLIYFNRVYSHAIRKGALLLDNGTVCEPTFDMRSPRRADEEECRVALAALSAAESVHGLTEPLLYGRVDLIRDNAGRPCVLELEIAEPSLSLPLNPFGAARFANAIASRLEAA